MKPVGRISKHAIRTTLQVRTADDLKRDVLKSDTSSIVIPEIDLELVAGTLGGKYSTLEGILNDVKAQLSSLNPFHMGDSSEEGAACTVPRLPAVAGRADRGRAAVHLRARRPAGQQLRVDGAGRGQGRAAPRGALRAHVGAERGARPQRHRLVDVSEYATDDDVRAFEAEMKQDAVEQGEQGAAGEGEEGGG